ncbi:DUF6290 family protein [Levilactobacillus humaensis]|uniref:DUF6290 family protein n=1 Tax=Levilactobacillus humaensis TaxID=2950375 RepID=UPI0021C2A91C|nr:DUF6290 family protein [Levilactobacillus humaensis]
MTQPISIKFEDETDQLLTAYTQAHGISKSAYIKQVVSTNLEDWSAIQIADEAYQSWKADNFQTKSWLETLAILERDDK